MKLSCYYLFVFLIFGSMCANAQSKLKFSVASFALDQSNSTSERDDSDGYPMALIRVTSNDPESLGEYAFNFGNQYSIIDSRDHGDELWLFVQRNAKRVKITRGNTEVEYELKPMVASGKVYDMYIKGPERVLRLQMVRFDITPKEQGAMVFVKGSASDATESLFGTTDADGSVAKNLKCDKYTYRVMAEYYKESNGMFELDGGADTHTERVALLPDFAEVTLTVDADADIYINNEKKGRRTWTGRLAPDGYLVECRQQNHTATSKMISVTAGIRQTITLDKPQPILGRLSVNSTPLDAVITIDGLDYGTTPRNIDIVIGQHRVEVKKKGYQSYEQVVVVKEGQTVGVEAKLSGKGRITIASQPSGATLYINGENKGLTPYTAEMASDDYRVRLSKRGYKSFSKRVHLDVSSSSVSYNLARQYFNPTGGYLSMGFMAGGQMGPAAALGTNFNNVNFEAFGCYAINSETVYGLSDDGYYSVEGKLSPLVVGGKLGYGVEAGNRVRITPQVGFGIVMAKSEVADISASFASFCLKTEYALHPNFSLFVAPEYRLAVQKGDAFNSVSAISSKVKGWADGFDVSCGISVNF